MHLPEGHTMRPPTTADAPAVAALIAACQAADGDPPAMTADELLGDWQGLDLNEEAIVIVDGDGAVVACADIFNRRYVQGAVYGSVHPDHWGRGHGAALVRWGEQWLRAREGHAPAGARIMVQHYLRSTNSRAIRLLAAHGYAHERTIYVMETTLADDLPAPAPPPGVALRHFVPGVDERATFDAVETSFRDMWERPPGEYNKWLQITEAERRDPDLWSLAMDEASGAVVGTSLGHMAGDRGWVGTVGVLRPWRGQGLGLALLRHTFAAFRRRGVVNVGLSVDSASSTGAPRLYHRAGMEITEEYLLHRKELRPGRQLLPDDIGE